MDRKSARKMKKSIKKACTWKARMYRIPTHTPEFDQFDMVFGGSIKADNRWVVLASLIPWNEVEEKYSKLFVENNGRPAIPVRVALGALILKEKMKSSDEELVEQIRESPYLQFFLGYEGYKYEIPFDPSMMVNFRKRLSGNILKEVNALIIEKSKQECETHDDDNKGNASGEGESKEPENMGTLIVDATCAPEDMRFPHDVTLLDEARRKTERIIDTLHEKVPEGWEKPRTYRKRARKEFLTFIRNRKPKVNTIRKAVRTQIQYVERNLRLINEYKDTVSLSLLSSKQRQDLWVIGELVRQQREMYHTESRSIEGRILSISKPWVRPIARGKARGMFEFGSKLSISLVDGMAEVHKLSWEPYNECKDLKEQIENYKQRYGRYPEAVCGDKIYRTRENLQYCQEYGIRLSGPKLGRPFKEIEKNKKRICEQRKIEREDESTRIAVEGKFGEAKRRYTLDCIGTKLKETSETSIMMVFLLINLMALLRRKAKAFFVLLIDTLTEMVERLVFIPMLQYRAA